MSHTSRKRSRLISVPTIVETSCSRRSWKLLDRIDRELSRKSPRRSLARLLFDEARGRRSRNACIVLFCYGIAPSSRYLPWRDHAGQLRYKMILLTRVYLRFADRRSLLVLFCIDSPIRFSV